MTTDTQQPRQQSWISRGFECLLNQGDAIEYDVVIVGSGYGGAIAASQLAGLAGPDGGSLKICVLERGNEYLQGMFPSRMSELPQHVRFNTSNNSSPAGNRDGLFDLRLGPHLNSVLGNGLGGGSLINAGVMIEASPSVFDHRWPQSLRAPDQPDSSQTPLSGYYKRALTLLGAADDKGLNTIARHTEHKNKALQKFQHMQLLASDKRRFDPASITVAMEDGANQDGVYLNACKLCGDCATGCNHNAKNSLDTNLLVRAYQQGVELYTGATVLRVSKVENDHWALSVVHTRHKLRQRQGDPLALKAKKVILAAGSYGSTEILMRSRSDDLQFSRQLGQRFSSNGDMLATGFGHNHKVRAIADESKSTTERHIGPTITSVLDLRENSEFKRPLLMEEMAVPGALRRFYEELVTTADSLAQLLERDRSRHEAGQPQEDPFSVNDDAIDKTAIYALMGDDGAAGAFELIGDPQDLDVGDGAIRVHWPDLPYNSLFTDQVKTLETLLKDTGGRAMGNPLWQPLPESMASLVGNAKGPQLTVHPLGGCAMGDDIESGVVDDLGQVFDAADHSKSTSLHDGLVVLDGAMIPSALGANPALTIAACALRAVEQLKQDWHFKPAEDNTTRLATPIRRPSYSDAPAPVSAQPTEVEITERIAGKVNLRDATGESLQCVMDITLRFQPKELLKLVRTTERTLTVNTRHDANEPISQLRIFRLDTWEQLNHAGVSDDEFTEQALLVAPVTGELEIMGRGPSGPWQRVRRSLWPWLRNRGVRDTWQAAEESLRNLLLTRSGPSGGAGGLWRLIKDKVRDTLALASHAGELRLFDYRLQLQRPESGWPKELGGFAGNPASVDVAGNKHIRYTRAGNPLRQFEDMVLKQFPALQPDDQQPNGEPAFLRFDSRFLTHYNKPLLRIVSQQDQVTALADMGAFGAYFFRVLAHIHLWSFRKPDDQKIRAPHRLPGAIKGLPKPRIEELCVGEFDLGMAQALPVNVRLTRYPREHSDHPPVVLIHGYSASGNTYTHPSLKPSMAAHLWRQGRDVWVLDLRTSSGMPTAMLPWHFEDVAFADIPVAIEHICRETGASQVDLIAHCMGAAMFSMAVLAPPESGTRYYRERQALPQRIRRAVLSQVGPRVVFSPENIFRAYGLKQLQQMLPYVYYAFRRSDAPNPMETVLDRLLNALPYPDGEFDLENPGAPWKKTAYTGTRHRMDGLYGRTFTLANMHPDSLAAIDDLFGPLNMDTLGQVIDFAINERVTNRKGQNEYVTHERLQRYWGFATLSVHGDDNGLADIATLGRMQETMEAAGRDYQTLVFKGFGHQDSLIGRGSEENFRKISDFLDAETTRGLRQTSGLHLQLPCSGPVIGPLSSGADGALLPVSLGLDSQMLRPELAVFVPVTTGSQGLQPALIEGQALKDVIVVQPIRNQRDNWWRTLLPMRPTLQQGDGILVVIVDNLSQIDSELVLPETRPGNLLDILELPDLATDPDLKNLADYINNTLLSTDFDDELGRLLNRPAHELRAAVIEPAQHTEDLAQLTIIAAACQYPAGLLDRKPAYRSYQQLADYIDRSDASPDLLLLMGDQVYTDASAGLFDASDRYQRFSKSYHTWLSQPEVRAVLRRVPTVMMPDDHEFINDWDLAELSSELRNTSKTYKERRELFKHGKEAYQLFQRHQCAQDQIPLLDEPLWRSFQHQGFDFFLLDTRTEREGRRVAAGEPLPATLISETQMQAFENWLAQPTIDDRPRFVVSASMLLPRRLRSADEPLSAIHSDAWDGYPKTLQRLLSRLLETDGGALVFLSGDEHMSSLVQIDLQDPDSGRRKRVHSIHSSGLYAPFEFVNSSAELFAANETFEFADGCQCQVVSQFFPGDGFARLQVKRHQNHWVLSGGFHRHGQTVEEKMISLQPLEQSSATEVGAFSAADGNRL
jgi:choline dehydrogenase-like flavoprotein/pimeloyl-ACP methyl ester carboxylesterase